MIAGGHSTERSPVKTAEERLAERSPKVQSSRHGGISKMVTTFLEEICFRVSMGYEDAGGFHYGAAKDAQSAGGTCAREADELCCLT